MFIPVSKEKSTETDFRIFILISILLSVFLLACADRASMAKGQAALTEENSTAAVAGDRTSDEYFASGISFVKEVKYHEAKEAFKESVRLNPDSAEAHYQLGLAYRELGDMLHALRAFEEAVRIEPDFAEVYFSLGVTYRDIGNEQSALHAFREVIRISPDNAGAHYLIGEIYQGQRLKKEAKEAFIKAINIKPDYAEAHYSLGSIFVMYNDIGAAFDEYRILIDLDRKLAYKLFNQIYK